MSQRIAIFGAGRSGRAASHLAEQRGDTPVCFDEAGAGCLRNFEPGDVGAFDACVFSPGFAATHPWRVLAEQSGKPCLSELAYAAAHWPGERIAVTGTNGKTTVTRLLQEALLASGRRAVACGNIGLPMSEAVLDPAAGSDAVAVVEISSFQAELPGQLALDALLWTNFAEDHLDRYATMGEYLSAKANLLNCLKPGAVTVFGIGIQDKLEASGLLPPSFESRLSTAGAACLPAIEGPLSRLPHRNNFELVAGYWRQKGYPDAPLMEAAAAFELSPHRLQQVAEKGGVCFWDDSKATNFEAALAAVAGMKRPVVWIGGGQAKGGDLAAFAREIGGRIDAAVLYGEVAASLAANLPEALDPVRVCPNFDAAVRAAAELAAAMPGGQVLLSPGFASFDQFPSYTERGKSFVSIVLSL